MMLSLQFQCKSTQTVYHCFDSSNNYVDRGKGTFNNSISQIKQNIFKLTIKRTKERNKRKVLGIFIWLKWENFLRAYVVMLAYLLSRISQYLLGRDWCAVGGWISIRRSSNVTRSNWRWPTIQRVFHHNIWISQGHLCQEARVLIHCKIMSPIKIAEICHKCVKA